MIESSEQPAEAGLIEAKRAFYRRASIAVSYDVRRWGGPSGMYVNRREIALAASLLPASAQLSVDIGTGTGRVLPELERRSRLVVGIDTSMPMLRVAAGVSGARLVQGDAFGLPLRNGSCDAVIALRVLFHFPQVERLLDEARRIVRPGGTLVCDTATWSPRGRVPLDRSHWGERVAPLSRDQFRRLATVAGWEVVDERAAFLVSPYVYRVAPLFLARGLERLEPHVSPRLLSRVFWRLQAVATKPATASLEGHG